MAVWPLWHGPLLPGDVGLGGMAGVFSLPNTGFLKNRAPSTLGLPGRDGADSQTSSIPNRYVFQWLGSSPSLPESQTMPPLLCSMGLDTAHVQHREIQGLPLS